MLPNGGLIWLTLQPTTVAVRELDRVTETIDGESLRRFQMFDSTGAAAGRLAKKLQRDTARLSRLWLRGDQKLRGRILSGDAKLGRRVDVSLMSAIGQVKAGRKKQAALLRKRQRRELWNQLVIVSAASLMAAYGQRGNPLSENNLVIVLSFGVWLFGDEVADMLSKKRTPKKDKIKGLDVWSYTAPLANLLTGWWLLSGRQHKRFVTGTTDLEAFTKVPNHRQRILYAIVDMSSRIAPEHRSSFNEFENVPVVATIQSVEFEGAATEHPQATLAEVKVMIGLLVLVVNVSALRPELKKLQIAWIVDTKETNG
jgi:hypothetical protein